MHIGLILRGGVEEGTEDRNPFPVFVDFIRRLAATNNVQIFSLHGANDFNVLSLHGTDRPTHRFAGADVIQLGTVGTRRLRLAADVVRVVAAIRTSSSRLCRPRILHGIGQSPAVVATVVGRLLGIPSVVSLVGGELTRLPNINYGELRSRKGRILMEIPLRYADALTVASRFMQKRVRSYGAHARLMPFGVDIQRFSGAVARPDGPPFHLLHVGTLCPVKDQLSLVKATRVLVDRGVDVELDVVGEDDWGGLVQREAAELGLAQRIRFHGWVTRQELLSFYRRTHVFVMASVDDVAPVAVLEAAASGVPVVGTDVGFVADWAPERAIKVPQGDPTALALGLERILSSQTYREGVAQRAQDWVHCHASLEVTDAYVRLYEELTGTDASATTDARG